MIDPVDPGTGPGKPAPPDVNGELTKLAKGAIASGADAEDTTWRLNAMLDYLKANPDIAGHATNALADGVASPADISRTLWQHMNPGTQDISPQLNQQMGAYQARQAGLAKMRPIRTAETYASMLDPGLTGTFADPGEVAKRAVAYGAGKVPGSTALGAAIASKVQGKPYADVMRDVDAQMSDMSGGEKNALGFLGGMDLGSAAGNLAGKWSAIKGIANPLLRGGATGVAAGAPLAAAYRGAQPEPESIGSRLSGMVPAAAEGAGIGGVVGAAAPMIAARRLAAGAGNAAIQTSDAAAANKLTNDVNFGTVRAQAQANGGTSPNIRAQLANPDIAPYVRDVRSSPSMRGASDAEVLLKAHSLMSERQSAIIGPQDAAQPGTGSSMEKVDLGQGKGGIRQAMTTPSVVTTPPRQVPLATQSAPSNAPPMGTIGPAGGPQNPNVNDFMPARNVVTGPARITPQTGFSLAQMRALATAPKAVQPGNTTTTPPVAPALGDALDEASQLVRNAEARDVAQRTSRKIFQTAKTPQNPDKKRAYGDMLTGRMYDNWDPGTVLSGGRFVPGQQLAGQQATLQELAEQPRFAGKRFGKIAMIPSRATYMAPQILDQMGAPHQSLADYLTNLGVTAGASPFGQKE